MPSLNWIGKESVINHDKEVPFKLLRKVKSVSVGDNSQNLIIHGDNLEALKALMPYYGGKIKCIYIDPPYNTGNEGWVYNDRVNSPKIKQWLGKVVGKGSEDLTRHDKWLCMMYPRLRLLRDLLADDGAIFVSIDDNEHCNLKQAMDEVFGEDNFVTNLIWKSKSGGANDSRFFAVDHEFITVFAKNAQNFKLKIDKGAEVTTVYNLQDEKGLYSLDRLDKQSLGYLPSLDFPIKGPNGKIYTVYHKDPKNKIARWRWGHKTVKERYDELVFKDDFVYTKNYKKEGSIPRSLLTDERFGRTRTGKTDLFDVFDTHVFQNPKPPALLKHLISISTNDNDLILDSFAGSGTTGHAVLDLNKEDGGNRKFILVEMEKDIAKDITAERIKRAIKKYDYKDGFEYCELDKPLFNKHGEIEESCDFKQFATYIYFTETQTNIDAKKIDGNFIGEFGNTEYYLIYKGKNKNILDLSFVEKIKNTKNKKVIYADKRELDDEIIANYNIVFKQIPYEVGVY